MPELTQNFYDVGFNFFLIIEFRSSGQIIKGYLFDFIQNPVQIFEQVVFDALKEDLDFVLILIPQDHLNDA